MSAHNRKLGAAVAKLGLLFRDELSAAGPDQRFKNCLVGHGYEAELLAVGRRQPGSDLRSSAQVVGGASGLRPAAAKRSR